ncbi:MAG TPA: sugar phosphate nucleotidyltransferase [Terracidiphilus sp.]|nr:sugar phosphate nucleotidyltransferase [Terracidiphilus sp.]
MKAMVLAAGLGTRLRPLTDDKPKALVTLAGKTLLEITLLTLRFVGVEEVIVNVHHFADMICDYLDKNGNFGMRIEISHEEAELLDTGGGLKKASWFFLENEVDTREDSATPRPSPCLIPPEGERENSPGQAKRSPGSDFNLVGAPRRGAANERTIDAGDTASGRKLPSSESSVTGHDFGRAESMQKTGEALAPAGDEPFILHNVDVLSAIDLSRMIRHHIDQGALATLAVQDRETSRYLLFDENGHLCGRRIGRDGNDEMAHPAAHPQPLAFAGIHVISPRLLAEMREEGAFSIIDTYLNLASRGEKIAAFRADEYYWRDLGRPENLADAERDLASGINA